MNIYEAIRQMKVLSDEGVPFSFSFMSYSYDRDTSHGIVVVENARINPANRLERNRFSDFMLNYLDLDTLESKSCWQMLLLEFNGELLELN